MMVINAADGLRLRIHRPTYDDDWEKEEDRDDNSDYQNQRGLLLRRTKERGTTVDDEDEERMKNSLNDEDEVAIDTLLFEESYRYLVCNKNIVLDHTYDDRAEHSVSTNVLLVVVWKHQQD